METVVDYRFELSLAIERCLTRDARLVMQNELDRYFDGQRKKGKMLHKKFKYENKKYKKLRRQKKEGNAAWQQLSSAQRTLDGSGGNSRKEWE